MNAGSWIDHIANDVEVRATLPDGLPLNDLLVVRVSAEPGNVLIVETLTRSMPSGIPARWVERGAEFISITFRIGFRTLSINAHEVDVEQAGQVLMTPGAFTLRANEEHGTPSLQINATTFFVQVDLKPMQHSQLRP